MFWKRLLVGGILVQLVLKAKLCNSELRKVAITEAQAICNDNSHAVFYIGTRSLKKWIIFFESGGLCTSKADCNERYRNKNSTVLMSSKTLPYSVIGRDILSSSESENPTFHDYTHVLVPYCSSDLWLGKSTSRNRPFNFVDNSSADNFSFRGQTIFQSVFRDLLKFKNLSVAEHVVVSGSSAGGIGVLNHAEWLLNNTFANSQAKLTFIIDSAWFINFQDGFKSRVKPGFAKLANISSPSCRNSSYGYSCCLSASCLISQGYFPSDLPVAFVFSLYDIYMFADVLKRLEDEGKTAEDHVADFLSVVSMYGGAMNESLELPKSRGGHASFFVPACFQHTYFSTSSLWDEDGVLHPLIEVTRGTGKFSHTIKSGTWSSTKITNRGMKDISIQDFLSSWVESGNATHRVIDSCIGAHCNPTCPDKIIFLDAGAIWTKVIKTVIITLSLVITVLCFGLKAIFMCYYSHLEKRQETYLNDSETSQARKELPLCKSDEAVSIACLSLSYKVYLIKKKKRTKNDPESEENGSSVKGDRNSKVSLNSKESALEEDSGSDLQDSEESKEDERDCSLSVPRKSTNDTESVNSRQEQQSESFSTMDGNSTVGSRAGSEFTLLRGDHGNRDSGSVSCLAPVSKDATDCALAGDSSSTKQILKGVSAYFNTGELVAIMGPSGCGKTTLLDLLTGRRRHGQFEGHVYINGVGVGRVQDWYACKIGYVLQLAVPYYEELTVRQNLFFAAHIRLPKETSTSEKYERVEQIIAETGLTQMADTVIGGSVGLGLSGGQVGRLLLPLTKMRDFHNRRTAKWNLFVKQIVRVRTRMREYSSHISPTFIPTFMPQKRRLCVALQLVNMPSVLFLDEPTSGLDASSSLELLNHLNLVAESGRLVILTIHQPRLEIFHLFHKILFLSDGQVAYYGEPSMAPEIFIKAYARATTEEFRLSEEAPKIDAKNPADTIMDLLNCPEARHAILDYYQTSGEPQAVQEAIMTSQENARKTVSMETMTKFVEGAGMFKRIFVLEGRTSVRQTLGQLLYFPLIFFIFGIIVGTVYWQAEERDGILLMSAYCVYCCASPLFLSSVLMAHFNKALDIFNLERADGCGRSHENVIQTFVRTTAVCVLPVIVCSAMSYFMVMTSYDLWKFMLVTIISLVLNQTWIAIYMMVICAQPRIAHRICPMVSAIGGFAGGFLVPRPQMPVVYNLLFYINPQFYGYAAITKVLLQNVRLECEYESTLNCISTDGNAVLARFGLDSVNPYENLVIMLGMTVFSLLLSWLFLEAKYFTLRCFTKTPPAFSTEEDDKVEILVKQIDDIQSEEEKDEIQTETPKSCGINPYSPSRRSAKSRLGLISVNKGFHSVKLPERGRANTPEMYFNNQQATDGEDEVVLRRRKRMTSVSGQELWKHTKQHVEERRIDFDKRMSRVQNIARRYTVKHSQSMRKRTKEKAVIPRRSTMSSSANSEAIRKELSLTRSSNSQDSRRKLLFQDGLETSAATRGNEITKDDYVVDGRGTSGALRGNRRDKRRSKTPEQEAASRAESAELAGHKGAFSPSRKTAGEGAIQVIWESVDSSEGEEECEQSKTDASYQDVEDKTRGRPAKKVSIIEFTDSLDV